MKLPSLIHDYNHAAIVRHTLGPRRELTLQIALSGLQANEEYVRVRFGGIENFTAVCAYFSGELGQRSELAWLRYSADERSKPGDLVFALECERTDARLVIRCSSLQVGAEA